MPNNVNLGSDFVDEGYRQPQRRPMPQREMGAGMGNGMNPGMPSGRASARRKKNQTASIIILSVEIVVFIVLLILFFVLKSKIDSPASSASDAVATEASEEGQSSGGVNVESDNFTLTCTKVQLANDVNGNPAAVIYFTFVNKTDTPLSMAEVFPPSLTQNGASCAGDAQLAEFPTEYTNKDMQVSGGQSVDCCFAFSINDLTSPLTLTIHDNYSTFTDIGSTEIPIS